MKALFIRLYVAFLLHLTQNQHAVFADFEPSNYLILGDLSNNGLQVVTVAVDPNDPKIYVLCTGISVTNQPAPWLFKIDSLTNTIIWRRPICPSGSGISCGSQVTITGASSVINSSSSEWIFQGTVCNFGSCVVALCKSGNDLNPTVNCAATASGSFQTSNIILISNNRIAFAGQSNEGTLQRLYVNYSSVSAFPSSLSTVQGWNPAVSGLVASSRMDYIVANADGTNIYVFWRQFQSSSVFLMVNIINTASNAVSSATPISPSNFYINGFQSYNDFSFGGAAWVPSNGTSTGTILITIRLNVFNAFLPFAVKLNPANFLLPNGSAIALSTATAPFYNVSAPVVVNSIPNYFYIIQKSHDNSMLAISVFDHTSGKSVMNYTWSYTFAVVNTQPVVDSLGAVYFVRQYSSVSGLQSIKPYVIPPMRQTAIMPSVLLNNTINTVQLNYDRDIRFPFDPNLPANRIFTFPGINCISSYGGLLLSGNQLYSRCIFNSNQASSNISNIISLIGLSVSAPLGNISVKLIAPEPTDYFPKSGSLLGGTKMTVRVKLNMTSCPSDLKNMIYVGGQLCNPTSDQPNNTVIAINEFPNICNYTCSTPALPADLTWGSGSTNRIVSMGNSSIYSFGNFAYTLPLGQQAYPANAEIGFPTIGGSMLMITGGDFGPNCPSPCQTFQIFIGTFGNCNSISVNDGNSVTCLIPAGIGKNVSIIVAQSANSNQRFIMTPTISYNPPIITSISQNDLAFRISDENFMIYGDNFGFSTGNITVQLANSASTITLGSCERALYTSIVNCLIPSRLNQMAGNYTLSVTVGGQSAAYNYLLTLLDNQLPTVSNLQYELLPTDTQLFSLWADDKDGQQCTIFITKLPGKGKVYYLNRPIDTTPYKLGTSSGAISLTFIPDANSEGEFLLEYSAVDSLGATSATGNVAFNVTTPDLPPEINPLQRIVEMTDDGPVTVTFPVKDNRETNNLLFLINPDETAWHGKWYSDNANTNQPIQMNGSMTMSYNYQQKTSLQVYLRHDFRPSANPYARFSFMVWDSTNKNSSVHGTVQVNVKCPVGTFNNIWSDGGSVCKVCPTGAQCWPNGDYYPVNLQGYYPVDLFVFMPCSPAESCLAGTQTVSVSNLSLDMYTAMFVNANSSLRQISCSPGYTSLRCGQCDRNYYRQGTVCKACPNYNFSSGVIVLIIIAVLLLILAVVNVLRRVDTGFIGILLSYWQTVAILETFKLNWPAVVTNTLHYLSFIYFNIELTSPECYVAEDNSFTYELKWFATLAEPLAVLLLIGILLILNVIWRTARACFGWGSKSKSTAQRYDPRIQKSVLMSTRDDDRHGRRRSSILGSSPARESFLSSPGETISEEGNRSVIERRLHERRKTNVWDIVSASYGDLLDDDEMGGGDNVGFGATLFSIFLLTLKLIYINLARKTLELFDCSYNPDNSRYYFDVEPNRQCYVAWWHRLLPFSIFSIVFYVLGIPLLFLWLFIKRRRYLKVPSFKRTKWQTFILQSTYKRKSEFRPETEYWDVVLLCRKLVIIVCQLMFTKYTAFQAQMLVIILFLFEIGHVYVAPYSMKSLNFLEGISMLSSIIVLSCGLMFYVSGYEPGFATDILAMAVIAVVIISSLLVIAMLINHIKTMYLIHRREKQPRRKSLNSSKK